MGRKLSALPSLTLTLCTKKPAYGLTESRLSSLDLNLFGDDDTGDGVSQNHCVNDAEPAGDGAK